MSEAASAWHEHVEETAAAIREAHDSSRTAAKEHVKDAHERHSERRAAIMSTHSEKKGGRHLLHDMSSWHEAKGAKRAERHKRWADWFAAMFARRKAKKEAIHEHMRDTVDKAVQHHRARMDHRRAVRDAVHKHMGKQMDEHMGKHMSKQSSDNEE